MLKSKSVALLLMLLFSAAIFAQQSDAEGVPNDSAGPGIGGKRGELGQNFPELKERILNRIDGRLDKLQKARECVSGAQSPDQLRQCRPARTRNGEGDA